MTIDGYLYRAQAALADCLEQLTPGQGIDRNTPRGLSLMALHIAGDVDRVLREIETLNDELPRRASGICRKANRFTFL
jgi:hypothetical protein